MRGSSEISTHSARTAGHADAIREAQSGVPVAAVEARFRAQARTDRSEADPDHAAAWLELAAYWEAYAEQREEAEGEADDGCVADEADREYDRRWEDERERREEEPWG